MPDTMQAASMLSLPSPSPGAIFAFLCPRGTGAPKMLRLGDVRSGADDRRMFRDARLHSLLINQHIEDVYETIGSTNCLRNRQCVYVGVSNSQRPGSGRPQDGEMLRGRQGGQE